LYFSNVSKLARNLGGTLFAHPVSTHLVVVHKSFKLWQVERVAIGGDEFCIIIGMLESLSKKL
jgi:hypothetical protein